MYPKSADATSAAREILAHARRTKPATKEDLDAALRDLQRDSPTPPVDPEQERKAIAAYNAALGMQPEEK